ncbi:hypothetical protein E2C01_077746 [Portunus trituberculatus]|uniref:Uncharacterized protein n=1 Tax=Portunus trituberculatus TaxID=210409 RepID=A0A5B7IMV3_PORTR|nr:hypothetical protein [Portunus trituberculatus]
MNGWLKGRLQQVTKGERPFQARASGKRAAPIQGLRPQKEAHPMEGGLTYAALSGREGGGINHTEGGLTTPIKEPELRTDTQPRRHFLSDFQCGYLAEAIQLSGA